MNNFDRIFIADKENDLLVLKALSDDLKEAGIRVPRIDAMYDQGVSFIESYKAGVEEMERQTLEDNYRKLKDEAATYVPSIQDVDGLVYIRTPWPVRMWHWIWRS